jgi:hypothetical protein
VKQQVGGSKRAGRAAGAELSTEARRQLEGLPIPAGTASGAARHVEAMGSL